jgi:pilus assembly protein CpaE
LTATVVFPTPPLGEKIEMTVPLCWLASGPRSACENWCALATAPAFDEQTLTALDETDECIIVATLDVPTLKNVKVALDTLEMLNIGRGHRYLLLNRADDAVGIGAEKVETILGMNVASQISTSIDIAAATNAGTPIIAASPNHPSSAAFRNLSALLVGDPQGTAVESDGRRADNENDRFAKLFRIKR